MCGAAPSLFEDLEAARKLRPEATILGVKYSSSLVPEIEHVWTQHGEMTLLIKAAAKRPIFVHARPRMIQTARGTHWYIPYQAEAFAAIDYVWPSLPQAKGSSGIAGAMWARHGMGFDEVILAGIGLSHGDREYAKGYPNKYQKGDAYASREQVDNWLNILRSHIDAGSTQGIYSMSGATAKLLGKPC